MNTTAKWTGAIVLSVLVHAGAGYAVLPDEQTDLAAIAGGEPMEVAVLGDAFSDALEAGKPDDVIQPVEQQTEAEQPSETQPVETVQEVVEPLQSEVSSQIASDIAPTEADVILPSPEIAPVEAQDPEVSATVAPETVVPQERPKPPEPAKPKPEKKAEPKPKKPEARKPVRRKAGEDGAAKVSQRKGQADGDAAAVASSGGSERGNSAGPAGNAAVSNYPGKVRARLNRAFRYPSEAKRAGIRGTAVVSFTVSASGGISGARVVRSAGSPVLDAAALEAVQRAAPFPKIPDGRSSWPFSIPLVFGGK